MHHGRVIELHALDAIHFFYIYKYFLDYSGRWNAIHTSASQFILFKNIINFECLHGILHNIAKALTSVEKAKKPNTKSLLVVNAIVNFFDYAMA
uniref:Uncharacterized protein n=1 Tax=Physcomitrium patens TaxID=3218 RepID=A0A2K1JBY2_PHYPA|nr:hypothetical protein PHYPA_019306 [Physcomitrium patens]